MTRPDSQYLARSLRATAREALWFALCRHEQGAADNILLFATRRGGSTFAMELIAANRGIRPLNQPLETLSRNLTFAQALEIPRFAQGQITSLDADTGPQLQALMQRIFAGEVVINAPTRFWRSDVHLRSNRLVLKITDAKPVIGWFADVLPAEIVYLTRHPIPQSLSCLRNKWTLTVQAHLRDPIFVDTNLSDRALALANDVMATGAPLQQFIVNWALENAAPMRLLPAHPRWTHVRYEDCVTDPSGALGLLSHRLGLADLDRMQAVLARPSQSSGRSTDATRRDITVGKGAATVTRWREQIEPGVEAWCNDVMETFGIDPHVVLAQP